MYQFESSDKPAKSFEESLREERREGERFEDMSPKEQLKELDLNLSVLAQGIKDKRYRFQSPEDLKFLLKSFMEIRQDIRQKLAAEKSKLP